jgi:anti-sigma regulatory factor (Ser/Thr protein kinase)
MKPLFVTHREVVEEQSGVGAARRAFSSLARSLGASDEHVGRVALLTTELAQNLERHAGGGELLARGEIESDGVWLEVLSIDRGPGITTPLQALEDGYSTAGTRGSGLGAVMRMSEDFDLYTRPDEGTVLCARMWLGRAPAPERTPTIGAICLPHPDEEVSGDGYEIHREESGRTHILVVDGLGHGQPAADATGVALQCFRTHLESDPEELIRTIHDDLKSTRGAAVGLCTLDPKLGNLSFTGVGNIAGTLWSGLESDRSRGLASHNGTAGYLMPRVQTIEYPWVPDSLLILQSDGLTSRWNLNAYPGLASRDPGVIAGVLYRDHCRGRDDVTVIAVKNGAPA